MYHYHTPTMIGVIRLIDYKPTTITITTHKNGWWRFVMVTTITNTDGVVVKRSVVNWHYLTGYVTNIVTFSDEGEVTSNVTTVSNVSNEE